MVRDICIDFGILKPFSQESPVASLHGSASEPPGRLSWTKSRLVCDHRGILEERPSLKQKQHFVVDLFAGCGGLSLGLERAGFTPALVNELSPDAMATYLRNRHRVNPLLESKYNIADIKQLVLHDAAIDDLMDGFSVDYGIDARKGELDLVAGGPPCQGFSGIGHRRSFSVEKQQLPSNHLYEDMAYVVGRLRPKAFVFENVRGLLHSKWTASGTNGEIWSDVLATFRSIGGYEVRWSLVRAKDYGTPQNRPRVIMVGLREDVAGNANPDQHAEDAVAAGFLPKPTGGYPDLIDLLGDLVDPEYAPGGSSPFYLSDPQNAVQRLLRKDRSGRLRSQGLPLSEQEYSAHSPRIQEKFRFMHSNDGQIPEHLKTKKFAQKLLPPVWGAAGPTITATSMPDDYVHFSQPRVPTVREWARLQMFPDWYEFSGKRTTGGIRRAGNPREGNFDRELPKYTQIGNAVPVNLAEAVGRHLRQVLHGA